MSHNKTQITLHTCLHMSNKTSNILSRACDFPVHVSFCAIYICFSFLTFVFVCCVDFAQRTNEKTTLLIFLWMGIVFCPNDVLLLVF